MKHLLKQSLFHGVRWSGLGPTFHKIFGGRAVILMFHEVQRDCRSELLTGTSVELFEHSLNWLRREGWAIVSLEECLERLSHTRSDSRYAVLTFDDGYRDNVSVALPILERNNAPFAVYVPTGALTRSMYSWWLALREVFRTRDVVTIDAMGRRFRCPDLRSKVSGLTATLLWVHQDYDRANEIAPLFSKAGISLSELNNAYFLDERELQTLARHPLASIGGHTTSHAALATRDESSARTELSDNRRYLENLIQSPVRHVAYPYGDLGACGYREERLAREVGFLTGVTTQHGQLHSAKLNPFALPRIGVGGPFDNSLAFEGRMFGVQAAVCALLDSGRKIRSSSPAAKHVR